ncbi:MAG: hypothetical protein JSR17_00135 [Proteobacteria bacterium]|nr:hypothetical protein [Pseudomonadota bacterium]
MLTGPTLAAAAKNDWRTVMFLLRLNQAYNGTIIDIHARDLSHPAGFRLIDYAEKAHPSLPPILISYGATISYDVKLFNAAENNYWPIVFYLIDNHLIDINTKNMMHEERWTILDYAALVTENEKLISALLERGAKSGTIRAQTSLATQALTPSSLVPPILHQPKPIRLNERLALLSLARSEPKTPKAPQARNSI